MIPTTTNMERNTDYERPHYAGFSNPFLKKTSALDKYIFPSTLFSGSLNLCSSLVVGAQVI
jgi:hypothetical protein